MIQLIGLLLCVYLAYKGAELLIIAMSSSREDNRGVTLFAAILFILALVIATVFAFLFILSGASFPTPNVNR